MLLSKLGAMSSQDSNVCNSNRRRHCRWEELAAKYGVALDWEVVSKALPAPADSGQESKATNGGVSLSAANFEAVEQRLKESKAQRRSAVDKKCWPCRPVDWFNRKV